MRKTKHKFIYAVTAFVMAAALIVPTALMKDSDAAKKVTPKTVTLTDIASPAYNKVKINWKKASGATHYKIYYRKSGTKKWNGVKTVSSKYSSYTHTSNKSDPIIVGQKYDYTVKSYNSKYKTYGKYNSKGLKVQTKPDTVKLTSAKLSSSNNVIVSWNKSSGCDYYKIYRKSGDSWKCIATIPSSRLSYTDVNAASGKTNTYTVKSYYSKTKVYGRYDKTGVSVKVPDESKPSEPVYVDSIEITPQSPSIGIGETITLTARVYPSDATNKNVIWENANPDVISLTSHGNTATVKGLKRGYVDISVSAADSGEEMDFITVECGYDHGSGDMEVTDPNAAAKEVFEMTNKVRAKYGRHPLLYSEKLQAGAMIRAKELEVLFSHFRPDGSLGATVGAEVGAGNINAENIARGQKSPSEVVNDWEDSPGHLSSMLTENTHMGVGYYKDSQGRRYWVQLFASDPDKICTITFDAMGGRFDTLGGITEYKVQTPSGQAIYMKDIPVPVKDGYVFDGWVDEYGLKPKYVASTDTLYATWK